MSEYFFVLKFNLTLDYLITLRHYRYEQTLACLLWKVDLKDVKIICTEPPETGFTHKNIVKGIELKLSRSHVLMYHNTSVRLVSI